MKRESNFEVMRTLAMFFIVVYHCLTHGVGGDMNLVLSNLFHSQIYYSLILCLCLVA